MMNDQTAFLPYTKNTQLNPYLQRLDEFDHFVFKNEESEIYRNCWRSQVFQNQFPLHVEIGSGAGHFMYDYCQKHSFHNFIGLDYRFKRSYRLAKKMSALETQNFRYLRAWGERLAYVFGEDELDALYYFFPDPWPKTKHHKKRLFKKEFLLDVNKVLRSGGIFYIKTDHDELFQWMLNVLQSPEIAGQLFQQELLSWDLYAEFPDHFLTQYQTQFEKMFLAKGVKIKSLILKSLKAD